MKRRLILERAAREVALHYEPEAFEEFLDVLRELYGEEIRRSGERILILYSIAASILAQQYKLEELSNITTQLIECLEDLKTRNPNVKKKLRKLTRRLEEITQQMIASS